MGVVGALMGTVGGISCWPFYLLIIGDFVGVIDIVDGKLFRWSKPLAVVGAV